jgi:hypothetical protein
MKEDPCTEGHEGYSWWEYDAQGIPLTRVCDRCVDLRLSKYRPEILTGYTQADVDEPIEEI